MTTEVTQTGIRTFDFSVNLLSALLWQDNQAVNLTQLLQFKQAWYDENQTAYWENWITDVFDLRSCNNFGLVVWAIILGFPLSVIVGGGYQNPNPWGFGPDSGTGSNGNQNFFNSNFGPSQPYQINLSLAQKRILLQLRYRQLVSRGTVPEINKILADLLVPTNGPMYVIDNHDMSITVMCVNGINNFLAYLSTQFDLIPRPAGVSITFAVL
jgi:hypothetical protein